MLATTPVAAAPVMIQPAAPAATASTEAPVIDVRHRDGRRWWRHRGRDRHWGHYHGRRHWGYHRHRDGAGAAIAGFAMGALIAGALSQPRYYSSRDSYCASRFRSYNPRTGTYTTYDGRQVRCR